MSQEINKDKIISFLKEHKEFLKKEYGVTKIALFGSYARGEESVKSDIDLLIDTTTITFRNRIKLKRFLEKKFNREVDIGYFKSVRNFIKDQIKDELVYA